MCEDEAAVHTKPRAFGGTCYQVINEHSVGGSGSVKTPADPDVFRTCVGGSDGRVILFVINKLQRAVYALPPRARGALYNCACKSHDIGRYGLAMARQEKLRVNNVEGIDAVSGPSL